MANIKTTLKKSDQSQTFEEFRQTLTSSIHEGTVEAEGQQRFFEIPQEVLEETSDGMDIFHLAEQGNGLPTQELLFQVLDHSIRARHSVQTSLSKQYAGFIQDWSSIKDFSIFIDLPHAGLSVQSH